MKHRPATFPGDTTRKEPSGEMTMTQKPKADNLLPSRVAAAAGVALREGETLHEVNEHIRLIQRAGGLTFGTDAYLLAASIRPRRRAVAVDLGSGTGIVPLLALARGKAARFVAVELQPIFCELIARNAALNGFGDLIRPLCRDVRELTAADIGGEVDLVTANPPYMAPASGAHNRSDEKALARHEIAGGIGDFCGAAGRILRHGGHFFCVFRPERLADLLVAMRAAHLEPKRLTAVQATVAASPSMVLVEAVKHAAPGLVMTPPLCLHEPDPADPRRPRQPLAPTPEAARVYERCQI